MKKNNNKDEIREQIESYLKQWKWYIICLVLCISYVLYSLRYATELYAIDATIKLITDREDENIIEGYKRANEKGYGRDNTSQITDEIELLKSKLIVNGVVEDLNLNIQVFNEGKLKDTEIYKEPPVIINFLENDSIINKVNTTLNFRIESKSSFTFIDSEKKLNFGDKMETSFGDIIITPNLDRLDDVIGSIVRIKITPLKNIVARYSGKLQFETGGEDSQILRISLLDPVPEKGIDIIDKLIEEYNNYKIESKNKIVKSTSEFINRRLEAVSQELSQVDLTAELVKKDNRLTDLMAQSSIYLQSERQLESQQSETNTQLKLIEYMENYLAENNSSSDLLPANMSFKENSINEITARHNELVLQRNRILKNSSEINPVVINLNEQINNLKQSLRTSLNNIKSSNFIKLDALNKEESRISSRIYSAPRKERQFRDINRQQNIKESLYLYLLQKREESAISNGISSPSAIILNPAIASYGPVAPKKAIYLLAGIMFGFIIPTIVIYVRNLIDNKIHNLEDIKSLTSIPLLGEIPKSSHKKKIIEKVDYTPMAEAFRLLRTNVNFMLANASSNKAKIVFITATTSQEGKSYTTTNLAKSLSFSDKKVLIIESDIRVPKANKYLEVKSKLGLTDYLINNNLSLKQVTSKISEHLDMITAGTIPPNPAELLMSNRMDDLFSLAKNNYEYIIVDTSAVGLVTDTLVISKFADLVIYVIRANYLDKRELSIAQSIYNEKRLPNMAILLNGVKKRKGYGYGYGSSPKKKKSKWKFI